MKWLGIIAVSIAGLVAAYSVLYPTTSYRFKITLNVDTPQGLKSGSSVMEVRDWRYPAWTTLGNNTGQSSLTGEAVFLDLGPSAEGKPRNLIALLSRGANAENIDFYLLPGSAFEALWKQKVNSPDFRGSSWELPKLPIGTSAELRGDLVPTLVTFANLDDPTTARAVRPDDFPQSFGKSVTLRDVKIEIVPAGTWPLTLLGIGGEPLTHEIERKLPWWNKPLPWLRQIGDGVYVDTRRDGLRLNKEHFKRGT
jgi:hypothetical protein